MSDRVTGIVKWFDNTKGFGFIESAQHSDIFVHFKAISGSGFKTLDKGQQVQFDLVHGPKGLQAENLEKQA